MIVERIKPGDPARDFTQEDAHGNPITLSDFKGIKNIYLIFNRGFT